MSEPPSVVPLVSVVMAAYNGAAFLRETIDSLRAQTMPDFEIVVVDDRSTDDTLAVLRAIPDPRLRVIAAARNGGPAQARCLAMAHARGRFVAALDQDDLCHPERFARQLDWLAAHPEAVLVTSTIAMFDAERDRADPWPTLTDPGAIDWTMQLLNPLAWSSVMMRGEAARALDPFERDDYRYAEDFDLYARIRRFGRIGRIAAPLVRYRLHPGGASQAHEEAMIRAAARVLADQHGALFGNDAMAAALLLSRHAGASYPPADAATLARLGRVMARLLADRGHLAPGFAAPMSARLWWRIARSGLRAGRYGVTDVAQARPAFARRREGVRPTIARDAAIGAARRISRRA